MTEPSPLHAGLAKPYTRWTPDTETAFLLALRASGQVRAAAAEIGRALSSAYGHRKRNAAFRARWDAVVAEHQQAWAEAARVRAAENEAFEQGKVGGWTHARRAVFLDALSRSGSVREAAGQARMSTGSAYRLRERDAGFAQAWDAAIDTHVLSAERALVERAIHGWEEPIVHRGEIIGMRRRYSDALLRLVLQRADAQRPGNTRKAERSKAKLVEAARAAAYAAGGSFELNATRAETDEAILRQLDLYEKRMRTGQQEAWRKASAPATPARRTPAKG